MALNILQRVSSFKDNFWHVLAFLVSLCNILLKETSFYHLPQRKSDGEHESSRRLKTQFLIEMEGFDSGSEQILLIGNKWEQSGLSFVGV